MGIGSPLGRPVVFLDRDGVLNKVVLRDGRPHPPQSLEAVEILPGAAEAVAQLRAAGFELVVVTNQPDVARGKQTRAEVEAIDMRIGRELGITEFRVCYHDDSDNCACRKPKPGLLLDAGRDLGVDMRRSFMVGDRWRDIEAGSRAGVRTVWIENDYAERHPDEFDCGASSLADATKWILSQHASGSEQTPAR